MRARSIPIGTRCWDVRTARFDGGWSVEMVIPFKVASLPVGRVAGGGVNVRRVIRRKNEWTHLTPVPASFGVPGGMLRLSVAGTLTGLDLRRRAATSSSNRTASRG